MINNTYDTNAQVPTEFGLTNHKWDEQSELTYAHARFLSNKNKVWLSADPHGIENFNDQRWLLNPQSQNSYGYANQDPVNNVDPDGKYAESGLDLAFLAYDISELNRNVSEGNYYDATIDGLSAVGDVAGLLLPGATGIGMGVRFVGHGGDANKAFSGANKIIDGVRNNSQITKIQEQITNPSRLLESPVVMEARKLKETLSVSGYKFSQHAAERVIERVGKSNVSDVLKTINNSKPIEYMQKGKQNIGYYNQQLQIFVGEVKSNGIITTVINKVTPQYIQNLLKRK